MSDRPARRNPARAAAWITRSSDTYPLSPIHFASACPSGAPPHQLLAEGRVGHAREDCEVLSRVHLAPAAGGLVGVGGGEGDAGEGGGVAERGELGAVGVRHFQLESRTTASTITTRATRPASMKSM